LNAASPRSARKPRRRKADFAQVGIGKPPASGLVHGRSLPWFPFIFDGVMVKLCRVSPSRGESFLLIRVEPGAEVQTHYHHGVAMVYTIAGRWRYREAGWVAGPGDLVIQPAGSMQTFETVGEQRVETLLHLRGALEFRDESGRTVCIENAETLHGRYLAHCALHGLEPLDVTSF
jgi:quercetin dioxygenase-like cupin family protein